MHLEKMIHFLCPILLLMLQFPTQLGAYQIEVHVGDDVQLDCFKELGTPRSDSILQWQRNPSNPRIVAYQSCSPDYPDCLLHANGTLHLMGLRLGDSGIYFCERGFSEEYHYRGNEVVLYVVERGINTPPRFTHAASDFKLYGLNESTAVASYSIPTCLDDEDGLLPVECTPPSGQLVDINATLVNCSCRDTSNGTNTLSFRDPEKLERPSCNSNIAPIVVLALTDVVAIGVIVVFGVILRKELSRLLCGKKEAKIPAAQLITQKKDMEEKIALLQNQSQREADSLREQNNELKSNLTSKESSMKQLITQKKDMEERIALLQNQSQREADSLHERNNELESNLASKESSMKQMQGMPSDDVDRPNRSVEMQPLVVKTEPTADSHDEAGTHAPVPMNQGTPVKDVHIAQPCSDVDKDIEADGDTLKASSEFHDRTLSLASQKKRDLKKESPPELDEPMISPPNLPHNSAIGCYKVEVKSSYVLTFSVATDKRARLQICCNTAGGDSPGIAFGVVPGKIFPFSDGRCGEEGITLRSGGQSVFKLYGKEDSIILSQMDENDEPFPIWISKDRMREMYQFLALFGSTDDVKITSFREKKVE